MKYELVERTQGETELSPELIKAADDNILLARLLAARGITGSTEANEFLHPSVSQLLDPYDFEDMHHAVVLVRSAVESGRTIWVHGDYDADGTSGSAIMSCAIRRIGGDPQVYIPQRTGPGYGLSETALNAMQDGSLLITVDCGIRNVQEIELAQTRGIDVIVTDHHTCPELLPNAACILNPKRTGETYANKHLCGAGVAFKLAQALVGAEAALDLLDLAALATIADVVPLVGENRAIVALGLARMNESPSPGIAALKSVRRNVEEPLTAASVSYEMVPLINAAGRMSSARMAYDLLAASKSGGPTSVLLKTLVNENEKRKKLQAAVLCEAEKALGAMPLFPKFIFLADKNWPIGILGPVAARLAEKYRRPTALFGWHNNAYVGSARSTDGVDLYGVLSASEHLMDKFGGHHDAAGMTVREENLAALNEEVQEHMIRHEDRRAPAYEALRVATFDFEADLPVSAETMQALAKLEPCGCANPQPLALFRRARIRNVRSLGKTHEHASFEIDKERHRIRGVVFGVPADEVPPLSDIVGELKTSTYAPRRGQVEIIARVLSSEVQEEAYLRLAVRAVRSASTPANPQLFYRDKKRMGDIYSAFRSSAPDGCMVTLLELHRASRSRLQDLTREETAFAYAVFAELGLIDVVADGRIRVVVNVQKTSLNNSEIYNRLQEVVR